MAPLRRHRATVGVIRAAPVGDELPWRDTTLPPEQRVTDLLSRMTLEEKVAQLYGVWVGVDESGEQVAPHQHDLADEPVDWRPLIRSGLGQLTRPFGSAPVDPALGARALARSQAEIVASGRHGIPALAHEECLAGFATWGATIYPVPLAWGASFHPELVEEMAGRIGASMRSVGVHQGLAPVLDVTRDYRWGRVEETIGEDPYLVATIGTAYVRGLESSGIVATLKHFVGYSGSKAGRNQAPVSAGPREVADVLLPPFEMAVAEGGVVGSLSIRRDPHPVTRHVATLGMFVIATWRGRGVGTALMSEALRWARSAGVERVELTVYPHNDAAIALYRKFGFVEEGRLVRHAKKSYGYEDEILMAAWLGEVGEPKR